MIDMDLLEKFYSKIFTTPRKRITVSLGLITIALASVLNGMVSKSFFAKRYFFIGLSLIILLLIFSRFIGLAFNSRRTFFLALLILIFVEIFDFFAIHLGFFELIVLSPAALATLVTLVLYFTSKADEKRVAVTVLAILLLLYPVDYYYSFNAPHRMLSYTVSSVFGVFLAILYIRYLDREYDGINMKEMLKSFILFWLTTDPREFEERLRGAGVRRKGFVKCLRFSGDRVDCRIVNTAFPPGPLRNVGGAKLVSRILEMPAIYLHSATKHELNPASEEDVERVVRAVNCSDVKCTAKKPFRLEGECYTLHAFPFDTVTLLILSGKKVTDDLPPELNEFAESVFGGEVMLGEAHNAHESGYEVGKKEIEDAKRLIEFASKTVKESTGKKVELKAYFKKERCETNNVCGHIAALLLKYDYRERESEKYCILMVDGNNMVKEFRDELVKYAREKGVELIALTTDDHSKTGISPKVGYKPVGSDEEDRKLVMRFLKKFLEEAESGLERTEVSYGRRDVAITVMGRNFFESIERGFRELGEKALYLFWFCIVLQMVITGLLGVFLIAF